MGIDGNVVLFPYFQHGKMIRVNKDFGQPRSSYIQRKRASRSRKEGCMVLGEENVGRGRQKGRKELVLSRIQLFVTLWTVACQAPLSMEFSRQEHWSGLPFPPAGNLPDPGIERRSPALQAVSLPSESPGKQRKTNTRAI